MEWNQSRQKMNELDKGNGMFDVVSLVLRNCLNIRMLGLVGGGYGTAAGGGTVRIIKIEREPQEPSRDIIKSSEG